MPRRTASRSCSRADAIQRAQRAFARGRELHRRLLERTVHHPGEALDVTHRQLRHPLAARVQDAAVQEVVLLDDLAQMKAARKAVQGVSLGVVGPCLAALGGKAVPNQVQLVVIGHCFKLAG